MRNKRVASFSFFEGAKPRFSCRLQGARCAAANNKGNTRCRRTTRRYAPFCELHCKRFLGVQVRPSRTQAGDGLFAAKDFSAGEPIAPLVGETVRPSEMIRRYGPFADAVAPYVVSSNRVGRVPVLTDGACRRGIGFYSVTHLSEQADSQNYRQSDAWMCNARVQTIHLSVLKKRSAVPINWIVATRPIIRSEEIVTDYGPRFAVKTDPSNAYTYTTY